MTILEDDVKSERHKLSLSKQLNKIQSTKRKFQPQNSLERDPPTKRLFTEEMLNGYRSNDNHHRPTGDVQESPVATLANMGNTCFLNSVLYTLRFAPTFLHNLHHLVGDLALVGAKLGQNKAKSSSLGRNIGTITGPSSRSTSSKDLLSLGTADVIPKSKVQIVTEKLHELFVTMHSLEMKECTDAYQPVAFLQAVREANFIFEGNNQQDAHELLVYLFDNIRETCSLLMQQVHHNPDLLTENEGAQVSNNQHLLWIGRRSWKKLNKKKEKGGKDSGNEAQMNGASGTDNEECSSTAEGGVDSNRRRLGYNFVSEDFEGVTLRRTRCLECESVTERKETFYDIPVPILYKQEDMICTPSEVYRRACVTSEKLCDSNKYLCEKCERYNEASREVSFERLPNIMVLQLKRFTTTATGVQKVNSYLPTPLELDCFCESCCRLQEIGTQHRYHLCCIIMHLGGTMASGHYIAYVRVTDPFQDYTNCARDLSSATLSSAGSDKSLNILKYLKPRMLIEKQNGVAGVGKGGLNGVKMCKGSDCCGVRVNRNVMENAVNGWTRGNGLENRTASVHDAMWLECDDEMVRPISSQDLEELLGCKPNSTSTPYLLFYAKVSEQMADE